MISLQTIQTKLNENCHPLGLAVFRVLFGLLLAGGGIRFWAKGWIEQLWLNPTFHFKYPYFHWVELPSNAWVYVLYFTFILSGVLVAIGLFYRVAIILSFVLFTYFELIDLSYYLNHYYFISLMCLILCFLPANQALSFDRKWKLVKVKPVKRWHVFMVRLQLGFVYFFAGVAKLHTDWLIHAVPLKIWLKAFPHWPLIGKFLGTTLAAYAFSWFGMVYDLTVPFFLSFRKTRIWAYLVVIVFHVLTYLMFPIGMFPFVMIASTLIFFPSTVFERIVNRVRDFFQFQTLQFSGASHLKTTDKNKWVQYGFLVFFGIQVWLPFRYVMYGGNLFWHEQGYRFSWRVMLMEKAGQATFYVQEKDHPTTRIEVDNREHLIPVQEKMMATQPDFLLQYAKYLKQIHLEKGMANPEVTADVFVTLNGRRSKRFVNPQADLSAIDYSCKPYEFLVNEE